MIDLPASIAFIINQMSDIRYLGPFTARQRQKLTIEYFKLWRDTALRESATIYLSHFGHNLALRQFKLHTINLTGEVNFFLLLHLPPLNHLKQDLTQPSIHFLLALHP